MKKNLLSTLFILAYTTILFAQNPIMKQWDKRFGGTRGEALRYFRQTSDGGYLLGGYSNSGIEGDKTQDNRDSTYITNDFWIIKTNSANIKLWDFRYGGSDNDELTTIVETTDKGYLLAGYSNSGIGGDKTEFCWGAAGGYPDYWIVKIDSSGVKLWDKRFGGFERDYLNDAKQTDDGGFILVGQSASGANGDKTDPSQGLSDFWIVRTDSYGNKLWDKRYGGTGYEYLYDVFLTHDGGCLLVGNSFSGISGDKTQPSWGGLDFWIVKIDSIGTKLWDKRYGGSGGESSPVAEQTSDGGYILGGVTTSGISGDKTQPLVDVYSDYWLIKIDSLGTKQWDKDFGGTDYEDNTSSLHQTSDGGYLIAGSSFSPAGGDKTEANLGEKQTWVVKTDSLGNKQWDKTLFTTGYDQAGFAVETPGGCFTFANYTPASIGGYKTEPNWDTLHPSYDIWMVKFCDTLTSIQTFENIPVIFLVYPNPASAYLNIFLANEKTVTVINLLGEIVLQKNFSSALKEEVELNVSFLSAGVYFVKAGNEVRKFIKE